MFKALGDLVEDTFHLGAKVVRTPLDLADEFLAEDGGVHQEPVREGPKAAGPPRSAREAEIRSHAARVTFREKDVGSRWGPAWVGCYDGKEMEGVEIRPIALGMHRRLGFGDDHSGELETVKSLLQRDTGLWIVGDGTQAPHSAAAQRMLLQCAARDKESQVSGPTQAAGRAPRAGGHER